MKLIIAKNYDEMSRAAAQEIVEMVKAKPDCVLGLATGGTPEGMYKNIIGMYKDGIVDFSRVKSFNLDEYRGLPGTHPQSYRYYMDNNLFNHVNINKENTFVPNGIAENMEEQCENYDKEILEAGGIDLQVLGIGSNGHIGFNEPSDSLYIGTHVTPLTKDTIEANSRYFQNIDEVPKEAVTMGLGGIMRARKILLLASGKQKADIISKLIDGKINTRIPASILQIHNNVVIIVDEEAAAQLKVKNHESIEFIK